MGRKRILWLASWYPNRYDKFNGDFIQRHAQAASIDNDIYVIHLQDANDISTTEKEVHHHPGLTEQIIYYRKGRGVLGKVLKQIRYFTIYKNAIKAYIREYGLPHCVHVHVPWKAGLMALWVKRRYGVRYVVTEHWGIYHPELPDSYKNRPLYFQKSLKLIFVRADMLVVVSDILGQGINQLVLSKEYQIVSNVVDSSLFKYSEIKYPRLTFLHVSNMVPLKKVGEILIAFKQFIDEVKADAQLILIGNRDDTYISMANCLGLLNKYVFFKGEISYNEVSSEMRKGNCLILNSTYETFSCVVAEALCCGLPVIATKVGVIPEVITDNNGIQINDQDDLAIALKEIFYNYSAFEGRKISEEAQKRFSYEVIGKKFNFVYNQVNNQLLSLS